MRKGLIGAGVLALLGCAGAPTTMPVSGIDLQYVDHAVRPQDDLYRHLNGKWLDSFQIPPDKAVYGSFTLIDDATQEQLHGIVDTLRQSAPDPDAVKLADLYASFMDEATLEGLGMKPLQGEFDAIDALQDKAELPALIAHLNRIGAGAPYDFYINQDARNSLQYAVVIHQSGLGMPDRDYYLKDDAKLKDARAKYLAYAAKMMAMAGDAQAKTDAAAILDLETALAEAQWTRVENRDPIRTYNKIGIADLPRLMPDYDWQRYVKGSEIAGKADSVIVNQPSYFSNLDRLITVTPLAGMESLFQVACADRRRALSVAGLRRRALCLRRHRAAAALRRIARAGSGGSRCSTAPWARPWAGAMWRNTFHRRTRRACRRWSRTCSMPTVKTSTRWIG